MATSEIWVIERVPQRQIADWIKRGGENSTKNSQKSQFSGFLPVKIILIMRFIILMQSGFLYRDIALELGPGTFILIMRLFL